MNLIKRLWSAHIHIPFLSNIERIIRSFSSIGRIAFIVLTFLLVTSSLSLLYMTSNAYLVDVPARGGSLVEGVIGTPRFVNPLLAISDADRDLVALVYSGLLKQAPNGTFIPDLAESYSLSEDGRTYTFVLKKDVVFQDGTPVTADDVLYTVARAQDPAIKSPKRANWDGVIVEKDDDHTVRFVLKSPYAPFIANATLGILPKALWKDVTAEEFPFSNLNTEPIGSGPYRVTEVTRNASGIPANYWLNAFSKYQGGKPYLSSLTLTFFENEERLAEALIAGEIEAASSLSPERLNQLQGMKVYRAPLNRVFGVFFNQNQSEVLRDNDVRAALDTAIDRSALIAEVVHGYGTPVHEPLPPGLIGQPEELSHATDEGAIDISASSTDRAMLARQQLMDAGWTIDPETNMLVLTSKTGSTPLRFTLATGNIPELRAAAEFVRREWQRMGADVEVKIYEAGDLGQNVIRPRKYDALLFGEVVSRELDLFAFWHSSQRNDPGLNVALYANPSADTLLENLRTTTDIATRKESYRKFKEEIEKDIPAVFLYSPDFTYVFPERIEGLNLGSIGNPSERFLSAQDWHVENDRVWSFLSRWAN